jgi:Bacterial Ig-like domain (group 3)/FG-GAP-like repeat
MRSTLLAVLCAAVLATAVSAHAANRALDLPVRYRGGDSFAIDIHAVFAGDFDADGRSDLLATGNGARFLRGNGDGTFASPVNTGGYGIVHGIADFDRDGKADLYLPRSGYGFAIMRGRGDGTFDVEEVQTTPTVASMTAGDFNGDTFLDIAFASEETRKLYYIYGDGAGGFGGLRNLDLTMTGHFLDVVAGDFDHNGIDDVFVIGDMASALVWTETSGAFTIQPKTVTGHTAVAGDVTGDAIDDLVTLSGNQYNTGWTDVFVGGVPRGMASVARFRVGLTWGHLALAQMNGTGGLDIVVGTGDTSIITFNGSSFQRKSFFGEEARQGTFVAAADYTSDGKADVITWQREWPSETFTLVRGNGDGTVQGEPTFNDLLGDYGSVPAVTDVNGDGRLDLIIRNNAGFAVAYADAKGGFSTSVVTPHTYGFIVTGAVAALINNDSRVDLLLYGFDLNTDAGRWQSFFLQANGTFVPGPSITAGVGLRVKAVADLTSDAHIDILDSAGTIYTGVGNGAFGGGFASGMTLGLNVRTVDVNNDGRMDVVTAVGDFWYGTLSIRSYVKNASNASFTMRETTGINGVVGLADVTGDGFPELFAHGLMVFRANGDGTFDRSSWFDLKVINVYRENLPAAADFDGDGKRDVAIPGAIFYGAGGIAFDDGAAMGANGDVFSTADFDGNGSPDVWMADSESSRISIIRTRRVPSGNTPAPMTLDLGNNPSRYADQINGKVGVAIDNGAVVARGAISLRRDSVPRSIYFLDNAGKTTVYPSIPIGTSNITVTFTGDSHYDPVSISQSHTVLKAIPRVGLSVNPETLEKGGSATVCAYADRVDYGVSPEGSITVRKDGVLLATFEARDGTCVQQTLTDLAAGTYTLTAEYSGDARYEALTVTRQLTVTRYYTTMTLTMPPAPLFADEPVSITASFPEDPGITGMVTFTFDGETHPVAIANGKAVLTTSFDYGSTTLHVDYSGSDDFEPTSAGLSFEVFSSGMHNPPRIYSRAVSSGATFRVEVYVPPVHGADHLLLYRGVDGAALTPWREAWSGGDWTYDYVPAGKTFAYAAIAYDAAGNSTAMGPRTVSSTFAFVETLNAGITRIKPQHITELQNAINGYRVAAGLPATPFASVATGTPVTAANLNALRTAIGEACTALGNPVAFTDPTITPGVTLIRAIHLRELRDALR